MRVTQGSFHRTLSIAALSLLVSCSGGDGLLFNEQPGSGPGGLGEIAAIRLISSANQLSSDADLVSEGVTVTAIVTDSANNLVENEAIVFSTCELNAGGGCVAGSPVGGGAIQVSRGITNETGTAEAVLTTGGDIRNRRIQVTAISTTTESVVARLTVAVSGTALTLQGPERLSNSSTGTFAATLLDGGGFPIAGQSIAFRAFQSANVAGQTALALCASAGDPDASALTDASGVASFSLVEPPSDTTVVACALSNQLADALAVDVAETALVARYSDGSVVSRDINFGVCEQVNLTFSATDGRSVSGQTITLGTTRGDIYSDDQCAIEISSVDTEVGGGAVVYLASSGNGGAGPASLRFEHDSGAAADLAAEFVAISPSRINLSAEPTTIAPRETSTVRAIVRDADNNLVKNQRIQFSLNDSSGGQISTSSAVTNSQGRAQVIYTASANTSERDSVIITATLEDAPAVNPAVARLTVGGNALRISLGTGNTIEEPSFTQYDYPFVVIVTDALGNPAPPETQFRLSIRVLDYQKGFYLYNGTVWVPQFQVSSSQHPDPAQIFRGCPNEDRDFDGLLDVLTEDFNNNGLLDITAGEDLNLNGVLDVGFFEDLNGNGLLDDGEDINGNGELDINLTEDFNGDGILTPGNVVSIPSTVELDDRGIGEFNITYAQENANWIRVELRATASVSGSESTETQIFRLSGSSEDFSNEDVNPPGNPSPYGSGSSCLNTF